MNYKVKNEINVIVVGLLGMLVSILLLVLFTRIFRFYSMLIYFFIGFIIAGSIKKVNGPSHRNGIYAAVFSFLAIIIANTFTLFNINIFGIMDIGLIGFLRLTNMAIRAFSLYDFAFLFFGTYFAYKMGSRYTSYDF